MIRLLKQFYRARRLKVAAIFATPKYAQLDRRYYGLWDELESTARERDTAAIMSDWDQAAADLRSMIDPVTDELPPRRNRIAARAREIRREARQIRNRSRP